MNYQVTALNWPVGMPSGLKRVIIPYSPELDMIEARRHYAKDQGFELLSERPDGLIALYWDETGTLIRLAMESVKKISI